MFPEYENFTQFPWNKALLTPRQHFIAHYMLHRIYGKSQTFAFMAMAHKNKIKINSRLYEKAKIEWAGLISQINTRRISWYNPKTGDCVRSINSPGTDYIRGTGKSKFQIYNIITNEESVIHIPFGENVDDFLQENWKVGCPSHSRRMTGRKVIYNPANGETKRINKDADIPTGWLFGSPNTKSVKGRVAISNGSTVKYILKDEQLPEGYEYGTKSKANIGFATYKDESGKTYKLRKDDPLIKRLNLRGIMFSTQTVKCPFCFKEGYPAGMKRHHFNNCKLK